jgi:hypothetical protein
MSAANSNISVARIELPAVVASKSFRFLQVRED